VLREYAADRQYHDIGVLPLDIAACIGHRPRLELANLEAGAIE